MILVIYFLNFLSPWTSPPIVEFHPIHASICEVKYNEGKFLFEVSLKVYLDDLETAVKNEGYAPLNLGSSQENKSSRDHLAAYLDKYFSISLNGQKLSSTFVGKELSDDYMAVWCYVEYPAKVSKGQKYTISNRVLLDLYSDQRNIMDMKMNSVQEEHMIFNPANSSWSFTY